MRVELGYLCIFHSRAEYIQDRFVDSMIFFIVLLQITSGISTYLVILIQFQLTNKAPCNDIED